MLQQLSTVEAMVENTGTKPKRIPYKPRLHHFLMTKGIFGSLLFFLLGFFSLTVNAQEKGLEKGDRHYDELSYYEAILNYESAFAKGAESADHQRKLAESYRQIRDMENAEIWYRKIIRSGNATSGDMIRYAEALRANGKYEQADEWIAKIQRSDAQVAGTERFENSQGNVSTLLNDGLFKGVVRPLSSNTITADWSPFIVGDKVVFSSSRTKEMTFKGYHGYDGKAFMDLFVGTKTKGGDVPKVEPFARKLNTMYHESNPSFTADGNEIFFTRNHFEGRNLGRSAEGVNNLQIYSSIKENGKWVKAIPFEHNNANWSSGHATVSPNGRLLFFVSDKPGGFGGSDIYFTQRDEEGKWSEPENLGSRINTSGNEMSPIYHHDGTLFFASDGHFGIGGMDLFLSMMNGTTPGEVMNLGAPINSRFDELCLVLDEAGNAGYFSSNRPGGAGDDDIYHVALYEKYSKESFYSAPEVIELEPVNIFIPSNPNVFNSKRTVDVAAP